MHNSDGAQNFFVWQDLYMLLVCCKFSIRNTMFDINSCKSCIVISSWKIKWRTDNVLLFYDFWSWLFTLPDKINFWFIHVWYHVIILSVQQTKTVDKNMMFLHSALWSSKKNRSWVFKLIKSYKVTNYPIHTIYSCNIMPDSYGDRFR